MTELPIGYIGYRDTKTVEIWWCDGGRSCFVGHPDFPRPFIANGIQLNPSTKLIRCTSIELASYTCTSFDGEKVEGQVFSYDISSTMFIDYPLIAVDTREITNDRAEALFAGLGYKKPTIPKKFPVGCGR